MLFLQDMCEEMRRNGPQKEARSCAMMEQQTTFAARPSILIYHVVYGVLIFRTEPFVIFFLK